MGCVVWTGDLKAFSIDRDKFPEGLEAYEFHTPTGLPLNVWIH